MFENPNADGPLFAKSPLLFTQPVACMCSSVGGSSEQSSYSILKVRDESSDDNSTYCPPSVCSDVSDDSLEWDNGSCRPGLCGGPDGDLTDDEEYDG